MILLTGGSGRLGTELQKHLDCFAPPRSEFNILGPRFPEGIEAIVHCAAFTDVSLAETRARLCYDTNVIGTSNLTDYPLVYISTEYVFDGEKGNYSEHDLRNPLNWYAYTKSRGEDASRKAPKSLVIRCLFKERPFRHESACEDQWTTGDYVDVIAPMVAQVVGWFTRGHFNTHDTIHVGTARKSTLELARQTREVRPISRLDVGVKLPRDTSLDCSKYWKMARDFSYGC